MNHGINSAFESRRYREQRLSGSKLSSINHLDRDNLPEETSLFAFATRPILLVIVVKSTLNFAFADRYGWQRDESGRR